LVEVTPAGAQAATDSLPDRVFPVFRRRGAMHIR